jgi:putative FmdB family regulatory protein
MPTYEYQCRSCAHRFDAFQSITAPPLRRCPQCGKKVDRLISSGAGFLFKGSGFHTTDYRSAPYAEAAKQDKDREGDSRAPLAGGAPSGNGAGQKQGAPEPKATPGGPRQKASSAS